MTTTDPLLVSAAPEMPPPADRWPPNPHSVESLLALLERPTPRTARQIAAGSLSLTRQGKFASAVEEVRHMDEHGYRPRADVAPQHLALPLDWAMDPYGDRNWCAQLNMLRCVDPFLRAYEESRDSQHLQRALQICLDWQDFHGVKRKKHVYAWPDMIVGIRAQRIAYLVEKVRQGILIADASQRQALAAMFLQHWTRLTSAGFFRYTNHTIPDIHGLTALLRVSVEAADARQAWEHAIGERLEHVIDLQFDSHGLHRENSPEYHFVARNMFTVLQRSGWYDTICRRLQTTLSRADAMGEWMRFPDGRLLPIGDSNGQPASASALPAAAPAVPGDRVTSVDHSCYCITRRTHPRQPERWSLLAIKAGFDRVTHKHNDELSFVWSESGCDIAVDAGKYAYFTDEKRSYALSARAHNLIEFESRDFNTTAEERTGHAVRSYRRRDWGVDIVAELVQRPIGIRQHRRYAFAPGRWLVIIDRFEAPREVAFTQWTHLAPEFDVALSSGSAIARHRGGGQLSLAWWASVPVDARAESGALEPRMQGWISRQYRTMEPAPALGLHGRAAHATIVTALSLDPSGRLQSAGPDVLRWVCGAEDLDLACDAEAAPVSD